MSPSSGSRSTRDRPAKTPLSVEAVVDAAVAVLRSEGIEAMTMRRVATALDTGAGSLYVYVAGRGALVAAVFDRVLESVELEQPDPARWREQLHTLLGRARAAVLAHPGIAAATMAEPSQTDGAMRLLENLLGLLLGGGLDAQDAAWTADTLFAQVTFAAIESQARRPDAGSLADQAAAGFSRLPADRFPIITAHIPQLVSGDADTRFRYAVDIVVDGALAHSRLGVDRGL